jgi:hypothetical protein
MAEAQVQLLQNQVQQLMNSFNTQQTDMQRLQQVINNQEQQLQQQQVAINNNNNNNNNAGRLKPAKPNTFHGGMHSNANLWLAELGTYFVALGVNNNDRTVFALAQLRDSALLWASSLAELQQPQNVTFDRFRQLFLTRFNPITGATQARAELRMLKQTGSVSQYISTFQSIMQRINDMNEADRVDSFIQGLRPSLQLECIKANANNVNDLMNLVQRLDTVYRMTYSKQQTYQSHSLPSSSSSSYQSSSSDHMQIDLLDHSSTTSISSNEKNTYDNSNENNDDEPSLSYMSRNRNNNNKWSAEKEKLFRERKCFICKRTGHIASNCDRRNTTSSSSNNQNSFVRRKFDSKNGRNQRRN